MLEEGGKRPTSDFWGFQPFGSRFTPKEGKEYACADGQSGSKSIWSWEFILSAALSVLGVFFHKAPFCQNSNTDTKTIFAGFRSWVSFIRVCLCACYETNLWIFPCLYNEDYNTIFYCIIHIISTQFVFAVQVFFLLYFQSLTYCLICHSINIYWTNVVSPFFNILPNFSLLRRQTCSFIFQMLIMDKEFKQLFLK